jgi:hypothetical protein
MADHKLQLSDENNKRHMKQNILAISTTTSFLLP